MNITDRKGKTLDLAVQTRKPKSVDESGLIFFIAHRQTRFSRCSDTFLGYGSLRIVAQLPTDVLFITVDSSIFRHNKSHQNC